MNTTESILTIMAAVGLGYWYGKKRAAATQASTSTSTAGNLEWLGSWAQ
jgi:hypothetical protein